MYVKTISRRKQKYFECTKIEAMKHHKKHRVLYLILAIVIVLGIMLIWKQHANAPGANTKKSPSTVATFNKKLYSIDTPGSIWWIVNKNRALPDGYVPPDLAVPSVTLRLAASDSEMHMSAKAIPSVEALFAAAKSAGYPLELASGYRSEAEQVSLYNGYVATEGQAQADASSAKPGTSEHQTGLAMDVCISGSSCDLEQSFGDTPTGKWLAANAYLYGFIIRYPQGKESITGYEYEPWHVRYVGTALATELHKNGLTMEEFFGLQ